MKASKANKILLLLLLISNGLFAQIKDLTVQLGKDRTILCGDTITLSASVSNWVPVFTEESGAFFTDVCFTTSRVGFIIGNNGLLYRTEDGGNTWSSVSFSGVNNLYKLYFFNSKIGFLTSFNKLLKTTDGGKTWNSIEVANTASSLVFINEYKGFLSEGTGKFLSTEDGGNTWALLDSTFSRSFDDLVSLNDAVLIGSSDYGIYRSSDAGLTWTLTSNFSSADICKISADTLLAASAGKILRSVNGGVTWENTWNGTYKNFRTISFSSRDTGFVAGNNIFVETFDGGKSWKNVSTSIGHTFFFKVFATDSIKIVTANNQLWKRFAFKNLRYEWMPAISGQDHQAASVKVSPRGNTTYSVKVSDIGFEGTDDVKVNIGFKVNLGPDISLKCGDSVQLSGGLDPFIKLSSTGTETYFNFFVNDSTGFAVGYGLYKTTDCGITWRRISLDNYNFLTGIYFTDEQTGYVSGLRGTILKTIDGGETWKSIAGSFSLDLFGISFINSLTGFVYGTGGEIYKTNDGGSSWHRVTDLFFGNTLLSMQFVSSSKGFAAGDKGFFIKTENGGNNWIVQNIGVSEDIVSLNFFDSNTGLMVGTNGLILRTTNGGLNWTRISTSCKTTFSVVVYINKEEALAMGEEIFYSSDGGLTWVKIPTIKNEYIYSAFSIKQKVLTVSRFGDVLAFRSQKQFTYKWSSSSTPVNSTSSEVIAKPNTNSSYYLMVSSANGCIARDTVSLKIAGHDIKAFSVKKRITCSDSTILLTSNWSNIKSPGKIESVVFFNADTGIVFNGNCFYKTSNRGATWDFVYINNSFIAAGFFSSKKGFAIQREKQLVLKTTDGASTWSPTGYAGFRHLLFVDSRLGFLAGDSGRILRTSNGGDSWEKLNTGTYERLNSIQSLHAKMLVVRSDSGNYYLTTTNGDTWRKIKHPAISRLACIYFINDLDGFGATSQGHLFATSDGGNTWKLNSVSNIVFKSVFFTDDRKGYGLDEHTSKVFQTFDGGVSWIRSEIENRVTSFIFAQPELVYASTEYSPNFHFYNIDRFRDIQWYNKDGFTSKEFPALTVRPVNTSVYHLHAKGQGNCYASDSIIIEVDPLKVSLGKDLELSEGDSVELFASVGNGNGSWSIMQTDFKKVRFPDRNTGYAISSLNKIQKTIDCGKTWNTLSEIPGATDLWFVDKKTGFVIGSMLYKTNDGGQTWSSKKLEIAVRKIYFASPRKGFMLSYSSRYLVTNDYGRNWKIVDLGNDYYIKDIFFRNEKSGCITLSNKFFYLETNNGGESWEKRYIPNLLFRPESICFIDSLRRVAAGSNIYKTTDGGKTWKLTYTNDYDIYSIKFVSSKLGFANTKDGKILKTIDGGDSWSVSHELFFDTYSQNEFEFPAANCGFTCTDNGKFAVYSEKLNATFRWEPAEYFKNPALDNQKFKVTSATNVIVNAFSGTACAASDTARITVIDLNSRFVLNKIDIIETLLILDPDGAQQLTVNAFPENAMDNNVQFYSTDTTVAVVDLFGKVTAKNGGQTTIYAASPDGKVWDNCKINVNYRVKNISIYPEQAGVEVNGFAVLFIDFEPELAFDKNYSVSVSNNGCFQVVEKGDNYLVITGIDKGYATLTVTTSTGISCTSHIYVGPKLYKLDIQEKEVILEPGKLKKLTSAYAPTSLSHDYFIWLSSDTSVVKVGPTGMLTAGRIGEAMVGVFYIFNFNTYDTCLVRVKEPEIPNEQLIYPNPCREILHIVSPLSTDIISEAVIYNSKGELVRREKINANHKELAVAYLAKGYYIIELIIGETGKRYRLRFVKI